MALVIVEREFSGAAACEAFLEEVRSSGRCLETHNVRYLRSYFSADKTASTCVYEAPDAESVRIAETVAGRPFLRAWTAEFARYVDEMPPPPAVTVVMQRELPAGTTLAALEERREEGKQCLELHRAVPVESFLSLDGTRSVCVASAPDAEAVRRANRALNMPATSIWRALVHPSPK